jgi:hypothetical protein
LVPTPNNRAIKAHVAHGDPGKIFGIRQPGVKCKVKGPIPIPK